MKFLVVLMMLVVGGVDSGRSCPHRELGENRVLRKVSTSCSNISKIDGENGTLCYRGISIEGLLKQAHSFQDVASILVEGEQGKLDLGPSRHAKKRIDLLDPIFITSGAPMALLSTGLLNVGTLSKLSSEGSVLRAQTEAALSIFPYIIAKIAWGIRERDPSFKSKRFFYPETSSYAQDFLQAIHGRKWSDYASEKQTFMTKTLEEILILHAENGKDDLTSTVINAAAVQASLFAALSSGVNSLSGRGHRESDKTVLELLDHIDSLEKVPAFLEDCNFEKRKLSGFGHDVYKSKDPRAEILASRLKEAEKFFVGNKYLKYAREIEKQIFSQAYFKKHNIFPNLNFYAETLMQALGIPKHLFPAVVAWGRSAGWVAHYREELQHKSFFESSQ